MKILTQESWTSYVNNKVNSTLSYMKLAAAALSLTPSPRSHFPTHSSWGYTAAALNLASWVQIGNFNGPPLGRCSCSFPTSPWGQSWDFDPRSPGYAATVPCTLGSSHCCNLSSQSPCVLLQRLLLTRLSR